MEHQGMGISNHLCRVIGENAVLGGWIIIIFLQGGRKKKEIKKIFLRCKLHWLIPNMSRASWDWLHVRRPIQKKQQAPHTPKDSLFSPTHPQDEVIA